MGRWAWVWGVLLLGGPRPALAAVEPAATQAPAPFPPGPTRHLEVEQARTLAPGDSRLAGGVTLGGLGLSGALPAASGGFALRADAGVQPGLEAGIAIRTLGAAGMGSLLADVSLRAKLALGALPLEGRPLPVALAGQVGGFVSGGGLTSGSVGVGLAITADVAPGATLSLVPGLGLGFSSENPFEAARPVSGVSPNLGLGLALAATDQLTLLVDGRLGWLGGFSTVGGVGLRHVTGPGWATDVYLAHQGNPFAQGLDAGLVGVGWVHAFR